MSSPPDNMKLEGLIEDNFDESAVTPDIVSILEPYRDQIEGIAASFEPAEQSWRDYRSAVWGPVPDSVMDRARVLWVEAIDSKTAAAPAHLWIRREDEPDIDSVDGVDLLVADRYEIADLVHAGLVIATHRRSERGIVAHVRFPPRCLRSRYIVGRGLSVVLPGGMATIEGPGKLWRLRSIGVDAHRQNLHHIPLADLAKEIMSRGAFVVFDEPMNAELSGLVGAVLKKFCRPERQEQPEPVPTDGAAIWELVIADVQMNLRPSAVRDALLDDMRNRDRLGRERYGTPLQANNGRDALLDAYQEALDGTVYMRQKVEEDPDYRAAKILFDDFLDLAYRLRGILVRRDQA